MIGIKLTIDDLGTKRELKLMARRISKPQQALRECGLVLLRSIAKTFKEGGRPVKWKPAIRVRRTGGKTLVRTARLLRSITMNVSGRTLTVGTNVKYGRIHQFGGTITPRTAKALKANIPGVGWRTMKKVTIPARPFLIIQDEDHRIFRKIIKDYVAGTR